MNSGIKDLSGQVRALITRIKLAGDISARILLVEQALTRGELSEEEANQLIADEHERHEDWEHVFDQVGLDQVPSAEERTPAITLPAPAQLDAATTFATELHKLVWSAPRKRIDDPNWPNYRDRAELA